MASTYSNLKVQLMATGENTTTWGNVTNVNLGTALEEAIVGSADVTFASGDVTLTLTDTNATQTARNMRLNLTGTTGGSARNLVVPGIEKVYIVNNGCANDVTVKNSTGSGISVPAGKTMWVYNTGSAVVDVVTHLTSLTLGTPLAVAQGGTGSNTATFSGANITALNATNITAGVLAVAQGGTGSNSATFSGANITALNASNISAGTVAVARGGTGLGSTPSNGQLLIGNGTGFSLAALTAGSNITITNSAGGITITAAGSSGGTGTVTSVNGSGGSTGLTLTGGPITTSGTLTLGGTLAVASGGTGAATLTGIVKGNGTSAFTAVTAPSGALVGTTDSQTLTNKVLEASCTVGDTGTISSSSPGFRGAPVTTKTASYTLALADAGTCISITTGGIAIPANGTTAFPVGTVISVFNNSGSTQTITITTDTLRLAGGTSTGTRTVAIYGLATLVKVASTTWVASGNVT